MSNLSDRMAGKTKQVTGKLTDNKKLQVEGKVQEKKADVKQKFDDVKSDIN